MKTNGEQKMEKLIDQCQEFFGGLDSEYCFDDINWEDIIKRIIDGEDINCELILDELDKIGELTIEVIYYWKAMEYLVQHDNSLRESLEIAKEHGFKIEQLSSEILAGLHKSQYYIDHFRLEFEEQINDFFNEISIEITIDEIIKTDLN